MIAVLPGPAGFSARGRTVHIGEVNMESAYILHKNVPSLPEEVLRPAWLWDAPASAILKRRKKDAIRIMELTLRAIETLEQPVKGS